MAQSCATCGAVLTDAAACPACGRRDVVVVPTGPAALRFEGFAPTIIIDGPDAVTGDAVIKVSAPGATSETRLSKDGRVSLKVAGAGEIGRRGEPQALKTLRQKLQADGLVVTLSREAARDARGEDAILTAGNERYVVQFVTAPGAEKFWQDASAGSALTQDLAKNINLFRLGIAGFLFQLHLLSYVTVPRAVIRAMYAPEVEAVEQGAEATTP